MLSFISKYFSSTLSSKTDLLDSVNVVADLSINPHLPSSSDGLKSCITILKEMGLNPKVHAFGTNLEGKWTDINEALRKCHCLLHKQGNKVSSTVQFSTKLGEQNSLASRLAAI